jgi:hypothetical protein
MTPVVKLVALLRARGVGLVPDGATLVVRPAAAVEPDEVEALRQFKPEIMILLAAAPAAPATPPGVMSWRYPWPSAIAGLGQHHVGPLDLCADCSCGSWVRYGATVLCFACAKARGGEAAR